MALIHYRIALYVATIALHVGNLVSIARPRSSLPREVAEDYRVKAFAGVRYRFLTGWTTLGQIFFAVVALCCDLLTLWNASKKDYGLLKYLKGFRDLVFHGIVYPSTLYVFTFFWALITYDREQVYPEIMEHLLSPLNNHVFHTAILPIVLLELWLQPRTIPKSYKAHIKYLAVGLAYFAAYVAVLFYTYMEKGRWLYPILKNLQGTIYFPLLIFTSLVISVLIYISQFVLIQILWGNPEKNKKKVK